MCQIHFYLYHAVNLLLSYDRTLKIVLFKSLRNSKRRNKGNFTSKSNSNKIKLCGGGGGQHA